MLFFSAFKLFKMFIHSHITNNYFSTNGLIDLKDFNIENNHKIHLKDNMNYRKVYYTQNLN